MAQTHIYCRFTWQAWHKLTSTVVLRGRRGADGTGWRAWTGLGPCDAAALCVAGVAQPHIHLVSRGRCGTNSHLLSFCVAGVGQMALGGALGRAWAPVTPRHFAWQAWHKLTSTVVSRGRRGTNSHLLSFCVAGVGQMALGGALGRAWAPVTPRHFAWQAWHNLTSTFVSRGKRGTNSPPPSFCVAGVALMALSHTTLSHTIFHTPLCHTPSSTHPLLHTIFHTPLCHTPLCHTPSFTTPSSTHHLSAHHFSHTTLTLSHTIFHTPSFTHHFVTHHFVTHHLSHTIFHTPSFSAPFFTHNFVTHTHTIFHTPLCHTHTQLCHTPSLAHHLSHTTLSHTTLSHTIFHHNIFHTPSFSKPFFTHNFDFVTHHL